MFPEKLFSMLSERNTWSKRPSTGDRYQKGCAQTPALPLPTSVTMNLTWLLSLVSLGLSFLGPQMEQGPSRRLTRESSCHQIWPPNLNPGDPHGVTFTSYPSHPTPTQTKQINAKMF